MITTTYHIDEQTGELKQGYPPSKIKTYGKAPYVITDEMKPYYHPAAERVVTSKKKLAELDNLCGTITTDKFQNAPKDPIVRRQKERHQDIHKAFRKAVEQVRSNNVPLSEETRALCRQKDEQLKSTLGIDAKNILKRRKKR